MVRVNRYRVRNRWYWRVWRGARLVARGARSFPDTTKGTADLERELRQLFPHWVTGG
jgi:hypothetical protein